MIQVKIQDAIYQEQLVTLNGNSVFITTTYNERNGRWYLSIDDRNKLQLISGLKLLPKKDLLSKYTSVYELLGGSLYCANIRGNDDEVTRDNFGTDKQFQLWYLTDEELKDYRT